MGFFSSQFSKDEIADAKQGYDRVYFKNGIYAVQCRVIKGDRSFNDNVPYLVAEFDILQRISDTGNEPGTTANYFTFVKKKSKALSNIKELLAALFKVPFETVDDAAMDLSVDASQPCRGRVCIVRAREGEIGEGASKRPFTFHKFEPWNATDAEIAHLRAAARLPPNVGA